MPEKRMSDLPTVAKQELPSESQEEPRNGKEVHDVTLGKSIRVWTDPTTGMEFIWVDAGSFMMGSPDSDSVAEDEEKPQHKVTLDGFWLGRYPVTQGEWQAIMGEIPSFRFKGDRYPVEEVSWDDVQVFIKALNAKGSTKFRLPSEAQWEYACRAGTSTVRYWGDAIDSGKANYGIHFNRETIDSCNERYKTRKRQTTPVGKYPPNPWGFYDMLGNVCEWVEDNWHRDYQGAPTDGSAWVSGWYMYIFRGGRYGLDEGFIRCADRARFPRWGGLPGLGFRLLRTD